MDEVTPKKDTQTDDLLDSNLASSEQNKPEPKKESFFMEIVRFAVIAAIIVVPIRIYIAQPFIVSGASMDPAFETGEYLIVDQVTFAFEDPERGDVVIFEYPKDPSKYFIKRVVGLPGEVVEIKNSSVYISDKESPESTLLMEPYVDPENVRNEFLTVVLADDEYFVLGDNRRASSDSRIWGPVTRDAIVGRPIVRLFPNFTTLPGEFHHATLASERNEE